MNQDKVGESEKSADDRKFEQIATNINQNLSTITDSKSFSEKAPRTIKEKQSKCFLRVLELNGDTVQGIEKVKEMNRSMHVRDLHDGYCAAAC